MRISRVQGRNFREIRCPFIFSKENIPYYRKLTRVVKIRVNLTRVIFVER